MKLMYSAVACLLCLMIGAISGNIYASSQTPGAHVQNVKAQRALIATNDSLQRAAEDCIITGVITHAAIHRANETFELWTRPDVPVRSVSDKGGVK
jgi:hypothetical protein